jgi:hypothetical protein
MSENTLMRKGRLLFVVMLGLVGMMLLTIVQQVNAGEPEGSATSAAPNPSVGRLQFQRRLAGGDVVHSSPTYADVNGDGKDEILIGTTDQSGANTGRPSTIGAYDSTTGEPVWEVETGSPVNAALGVANLDGQGDLEVVVPVGGSVYNNHHHIGGVYVYNARTGALIWKWFSKDDIPNAQGDGYSDGVFATPAIGDVDNDGDMEIAFGSWDRDIYMLDHRGREVWSYHNADTIWSSAAMADLNGDGYLEIITGADISAGGVLPDGTIPETGGFMYIFDRFGNKLVRNWIPGAIYSSPSIGDLEGDGDLEIVVGMQRPEETRHLPGHVYVWDHNGNIVPGWPRETSLKIGVSSPGLGDVDGDGDLEIFIGSEDGRVYGFHHNGNTVAGWPTEPFSYEVRSSPTVADYDGDGELEVLIAFGWSVFALNKRGDIESEWNSGYTIVGSPAIGDPDKDGKVEIAIGGSHYSDESHGYLYVWETGSADGAGFPWPMFKQNAQHTALYPLPPRLDVSVDSAFVIHDTTRDGRPVPLATTTIKIRNVGGGVINWAAASADSRITLSPSSGALTSNQETLLVVTIDTRNLRPGTHELGEIILTAKGADNSSAAAPISVPVEIRLGDFQQVFLPLVRK